MAKVSEIFCCTHIGAATENKKHTTDSIQSHHMTCSSPNFYKSLREENCVGQVSKLFDDLKNTERVSAFLTITAQGNSVQAGPPGSHAPAEHMTHIHNHLDSSKIWKQILPWATEVEYTIPHPNGDITAFDTNSGGEAKVSRNSTIESFSATTTDAKDSTPWRIGFTRTLFEPTPKTDFNASRFSRVKIINTKRFFYETERSSWIFKLVVSWEGATKEEAKENGKTYSVFVETNDTTKASIHPLHSTASFLEKVLDIVSLEGRRQILDFKFEV